ncbi:MAG: glycosyltransferase family 2 protein [Emcibacter sp.]|nr:glycosyltransferase family 2 protein [Emcibacter sp.]
MNLGNLSIIIPLGPYEDQLPALLDDLSVLGPDTEIILVSCGDKPLAPIRETGLRCIMAAQGRAIQQNAGAKAARYDLLWFLHADSRVTAEMLIMLEHSLAEAPEALHYFHLKFRKDGPRGMWLNEWGTRFRSQILKIPFGDQGFCLSKKQFERIGGFPEDAPYGEDHLLVWYARQAGISLRCTGTALQTSARKYREQGWGALTLKYQWLWFKQALPEMVKLIRGKDANPL